MNQDSETRKPETKAKTVRSGRAEREQHDRRVSEGKPERHADTETRQRAETERREEKQTGWLTQEGNQTDRPTQ